MRRIRFILLYLLLAQCTYTALASPPAPYSQEGQETALAKRDGKGALAKAASRHGRTAVAALGGVLATAGAAVGIHKYKKAKAERKAKHEAQAGMVPGSMGEPLPGDMAGGQMMRRGFFDGEYQDKSLQRRGVEQAGKAMAKFFTKPGSHALTAGVALAAGGGVGAAAMHHHDKKKHAKDDAMQMDGSMMDPPPQKRGQSVEDMEMFKRDPNAGEMAKAIIKPVIQGAKQIKGTTVHVGKDLIRQASHGFKQLPASQRQKIAAVGAVGAVAAAGGGAIALDRKLSKKKTTTGSTMAADRSMQMQAEMPMQMPMSPMKRSIAPSEEELSDGLRFRKRTLEKTASDLSKASGKAGKGLSKAGKAGVAVAGLAAVAAAGTWMVNKFRKKPAPPAPAPDMMPMDAGGAPMVKRSLLVGDEEVQGLQRRMNVLAAGAAAVTTAVATGAAAFHYGKQKGELNVYSKKNQNSMMGGMGGMGGGYMRRDIADAMVNRDGQPLSVPRIYRRSLVEDVYAGQKRFLAGGEIDDEIFYRRDPEPNFGKIANTVKNHAASIAGKVSNAAKGAFNKGGGANGKALAITAAAGIGIMGAAVGVKHLFKKKGSDQPQGLQQYQPAPIKRSLSEDEDDDIQHQQRRRAVGTTADDALAKRHMIIQGRMNGAAIAATVAGVGLIGAAIAAPQFFKKRGLDDLPDIQSAPMKRSLSEKEDDAQHLQKRATGDKAIYAGAGLAFAAVSSVIAHHVGKNEGQIKVLSQKTNAGASGYGGGMYRRSEIPSTASEEAGLEKRGLHLPNGSIISDGVLLGAGAAITAATGLLAEKYGHLEGQVDGMRKSLSRSTSSGY